MALSRPGPASFASPFQIPASNIFDSDSLRAEGRGRTIADLFEMRERGLDQLQDGRPVEAVSNLERALSGLCDHFVPTNTIVIETTWSLIDAHKENHHQHQVTTIMTWLSRMYSSSLGLWHPQALLHYIRVVERLQDFHRSSDADILENNFLSALRNAIDPREVVLVVQSEGSGHFVNGTAHSFFATDLRQFFVECEDEVQGHQQIKLARLMSAVRLSGMHDVLDELILRSELNLPPLQNCEVEFRLILIRFHIANGDENSATIACKLARQAFSQVILGGKSTNLEDLFRQPRELAAVHALNGDLSGHNRVLNWTCDRLQERVTLPSKQGRRGDDVCSFVDRLILIGQSLQQRSGWADASPWFERAWRLSIKHLSCKSS
jgi:hypothetical protein